MGKRQMWMEVGRVSPEVQKLKVQDLSEGNEYFIRIFAKNEVGFSDPLENDEPFKVVRPADYKEEEEDKDAKADETPSLSFTTETLSSWMREANMDANIQSYTKSSVLRRTSTSSGYGTTQTNCSNEHKIHLCSHTTIHQLLKSQQTSASMHSLILFFVNFQV